MLPKIPACVIISEYAIHRIYCIEPGRLRNMVNKRVFEPETCSSSSLPTVFTSRLFSVIIELMELGEELLETLEPSA